MSNRLTKQSVENLKVATLATAEPAAGGYVVRLLGPTGRAAYLNGAETIQVYASLDLVRRAIRRVRPDLAIQVGAEI